MRIVIRSNESEVVFALNDSRAARDLYAQLPLTVEVKDFGGNEKIFYPPKKLDARDAPPADAKRGSLCLFAPWGNVVMFYEDFGRYQGLLVLGESVSGKDAIAKLRGTVTVSVQE